MCSWAAAETKKWRCHFYRQSRSTFSKFVFSLQWFSVDKKKTTEFCNSTSSFSVFFPVWLFLSACFCSLHPHLGVLHLGQNVLELEKLILGSLKCSCKQALMDETAKRISFTSLCWETQLFVLQVLGAHLRFRWQMLSDVWHLDVSDN